MENHSYDEIIGPAGSSAAGNAPYTNSLANACGLATNYHNVTHPSLPNYLSSVAGTTSGVQSDCAPADCPQTTPTLFGQLDSVHRSWRGYDESMPTNCDTESVGNYAAKHNPAVYYPALSSVCAASDVPMGSTSGAFATALTSGALPAFSFVTPDICDDTHDCPIATGDHWLSTWVPRIVGSPAYRDGEVVLFITWDEGSGDSTSGCATNTTASDCHVATLVVSPSTPAGSRSGVLFNHYALLRTTEQLLGLGFLGAAAQATSMRTAFRL